jgi:hypothetical protein
MSLILSGTKTAIIAGTVLQCVEVYNGESYTIPFTMSNNAGDPVNITGWTFAPTVKWYTTNITYPSTSASIETITLANLTLLPTQPTPNPPTGMTAAIDVGTAGTGYIYVPSTINGGQTIGLNDSTSLLAIISLAVTRTNSYGKTDKNIEPIGMIIRYI